MDQLASSQVAEIVGLAFGDGSLCEVRKGKSLRFQLRGDANEDRKHYDGYIIPLFNKHVSLPIMGREVGIVESKHPYASYGICMESREVGKYLHKLGIPIGIKDELPVPHWIKSKPSYLAGFLQWLLDTDGSIFCKKNYSTPTNKTHKQIWLKIGTTSRELAQDVARGNNNIWYNLSFKIILTKAKKL